MLTWMVRGCRAKRLNVHGWEEIGVLEVRGRGQREMHTRDQPYAAVKIENVNKV